MSRRTVRLFVAGRVQGVGFRAFLIREANALGLDGWARNRADGSVEALSESLAKLSTSEVQVRVIRQAVGQALHTTTATRQSRKGRISSWKAVKSTRRTNSSVNSRMPARRSSELKTPGTTCTR